MKIKKMYQGTAPENKILNTHSDSQTDVYSCDYINKLNTYSTEEQVIGTWIDGKTLYSKTLVFTVLPNTTNEVSISDLNYDTIMIDYGASFLLNKDNSIKPITCYESSSYYIRTETNHGGKMLRVYTQGSWYYEGTITVTVKYTKTTD